MLSNWRRLLRVPWTGKEIKPVNLKGNQPWIFIGRTDPETEASILWPPEAKSPLIGKDSFVGKDWGQEEKGVTEDEMVRWHHQLNGNGLGWTSGVGDGLEAWCAVVHGVTKSWTRLSDWTELSYCFWEALCSFYSVNVLVTLSVLVSYFCSTAA